ncbi:AAA family ATPase [Candidatus Woesearchaeota archaeon]|nr:AAA family ATPase [Candidatus Woesearchaeota archaeon]
MRLYSITLHNIRSFEEFHLDFAEGITLLTGDIGSGKTTLLLAIDFALFGIRRGELNGSSLLRNGCDAGSVTLSFSLPEGTILIKRNLKRMNQEIKQDFGYLEINGMGQEYTASELKQHILELLHYPQELLTKKSSLYRYTVYTPQEELKLILSSDAEERLQTLRKVFLIDKYKRIAENTKILLSVFREKKREFQGKLADVPILEQHYSQEQKRAQDLDVKLQSAKEAVLPLRLQLAELDKTFTDLEKELKACRHQQKEFDITTALLAQHTRSKNVLTQRLVAAETSLRRILPELQTELSLETIQASFREKQQLQQNLLEQHQHLQKQLSKISLQKQHSQHLHDSISTLDNCPVCFQLVSPEHKSSLLSREEETIQTLTTEEQEVASHYFRLQQQLLILEEELQRLQQQERKAHSLLLKKQEAHHLQTDLERIHEEETQLDTSIAELSKKQTLLSKTILSFQHLTAKLQTFQKEIEQTRTAEKEAAILEATLQKELLLAEGRASQLHSDLEMKQQLQKQLERHVFYQDWLGTKFLSLLEYLEQQLFLNAHKEFQLFFQQWFSILVENEEFHVRLNEQFTPCLQQQGYDLDFENLSGGERSSVALAYRLALNQVINSFLSQLNTKGLLILDEPTDGFSNEQLNRLRLVFEQLHMQQILLVSHENTLETFVDSLLRLEKRNGTSVLV